MISNEIIKIASNTKNVGCTNKYNFKSNLKNSLCGDKIKIELMVKKSKINSMKYETESCVYCEASASLLSRKIKNLEIYIAKKDLILLKKIFTNEKHFKSGKLSKYDIVITNQNSEEIAHFTGIVYRTGKEWFPKN